MPGNSIAELEHREEGLLRHVDPTHGLHALLPLLLLLQQLALAADVAAVALRDHVLAERLDRLARDDVLAELRLDRNGVLLAVEGAARGPRHGASAGGGLVAVR